MKTTHLPELLAVIATFLLFPASLLLAQGPLTPPGAPAPTMKTLDQIEPRTPISALPFTISASGSYYLTGNLTASANGAAITVSADNVTIDLGGFTFAGSSAGTRTGISVPVAQKALCVRNGTLTGWTNGAIAGIQMFGGLYENLRLTANGAVTAMHTGGGATVRGCVASVNTTTNAAAITLGSTCLLSDCVASGNSFDGIQIGNASTIVNTTATGNGNTGIFAGTNNTITHCNVSGNSASGMITSSQCTIAQCTANNNIGASGTGIFTSSDSTLSDCTAANNGNVGMQVGSGCTIHHCSVAGNASHGLVILARCLATACAFESNNTGNFANRAGVVLQAGGNRIDSCTFGGNNVAGLISTGTDVACIVNQCTFSKHPKTGLIVATNCQVAGCTFESNNTSNTAGEAGLVVTGSGNRIDGNYFTNNSYAGMVANAAGGNMIVRNSFRGAQFYTHPNNTIGPFVDTTAGGGTIGSTSPWANFGY